MKINIVFDWIDVCNLLESVEFRMKKDTSTNPDDLKYLKNALKQIKENSASGTLDTSEKYEN